MDIKELAKELNMDYEKSLKDRFLDSDEMYSNFLKKLINDQNMAQINNAMLDGDYQTVLLRAHNLKGVTAMLGLNDLSEAFRLVVNIIRTEDYDPLDLVEAISAARDKMEETVETIKELD